MTRRTERVVIQEAYPDGTLLPEHMRLYGTLKTVHGLRVVEVDPDYYFSGDLRVSAKRLRRSEGDAENGWIVVDEQRPREAYSDYYRTKPEALMEMVGWAARLASRGRP